MRYDHFGNYHVDPLDRMAHKFNTSVPGLLGYRTQRGGGDSPLQETLESGYFSDYDYNRPPPGHTPGLPYDPYNPHYPGGPGTVETW